jgi:plasmid stabilization system protein ParE
MKTYNVKVRRTAEKDIDSIADFLFDMLSPEGAYRYLDVVGQEIKSLSIYADCFSISRSRTIQSVHPKARRMVSHNHKFVYVFHVEGDTVFLDRVLIGRMIVD